MKDQEMLRTMSELNAILHSQDDDTFEIHRKIETIVSRSLLLLANTPQEEKGTESVRPNLENLDAIRVAVGIALFAQADQISKTLDFMRMCDIRESKTKYQDLAEKVVAMSDTLATCAVAVDSLAEDKKGSPIVMASVKGG